MQTDCEHIFVLVEENWLCELCDYEAKSAEVRSDLTDTGWKNIARGNADFPMGVDEDLLLNVAESM